MAGAWEILAARRNKVLVFILAPPDPRVSLRWAINLRKMVVPTAECQVVVTGGLPYGPARNQGLATAIGGGYNWLAFLDSDTLPPPDWIPRLLAAQRDFISGLYFRKSPPYDPAAANYEIVDGDLRAKKLPPYQPGEIMPVDFIPTGALMISRRCIEAMLAKYPRPFEWGLDIARVPGDDGLLPSVSEDYMYSWRAKGLGFQPWLHTGVMCAHEMPGLATVKGLEPTTTIGSL